TPKEFADSAVQERIVLKEHHPIVLGDQVVSESLRQRDGGASRESPADRIRVGSRDLQETVREIDADDLSEGKFRCNEQGSALAASLVDESEAGRIRKGLKRPPDDTRLGPRVLVHAVLAELAAGRFPAEVGQRDDPARVGPELPIEGMRSAPSVVEVLGQRSALETPSPPRPMEQPVERVFHPVHASIRRGAEEYGSELCKALH